MPREIPDVPKGWKPPQPDSGRSYEIELITPMVGGGATAGVVDLDFPIRPTAIRGHLRHWWRLVRGYSLGEGMWRREEEVFGSTEFPSPVTVSVTPLTERKDRKLLAIRSISPTSSRGYVLFPSIDKKQDLLDTGFRFRVGVSCCNETELLQRRTAQNRSRKPSEQLPPTITPITDEIDAALKAWVLFGGVGARTRRGCGSLRVFKESKTMFLSVSPNELLMQVLRQMPTEFQVFQAKSQQSHLQAWDLVIELLKKFRQSVLVRQGEPRKKFPEGETLRRMTGRRSRRGRAYSEEELPNGFPRAELGLPIVFQFKDRDDPEQMIVLPTGTDGAGKPLQRMSSPVILKPIPVSEKQSVATIMVIHRPKLPTIDVAPATDQGQARRTTSHPVTAPHLATYPNSPLAGSPAGSAIEAFLKFTGFTEVTR